MRNIIIILLLLINSFIYANEKIVKIATLEDYAPFCISNQDTPITQTINIGDYGVEFSGYSWDIVRTSFQEMGYTIQLTVVPWARGLEYIQKGKVDLLFPAGKNADREKVFDFPNEYVNKATFVIYLREKDNIKWENLESLKGLTIGVKRKFYYGDKWKEATGIIEYNVKTIEQGFRMLDAKRFDGFLGYEYNWDFVLKKLSWKNKFRKLPVFDSSIEYLVALKTNPKGKKFLKDFDIGKEKLRKNGKLKKIKNKWNYDDFGE